MVFLKNNAETKQRWSIRKTKTAVGPILLGALLASGLAYSPAAFAEEVDKTTTQSNTAELPEDAQAILAKMGVGGRKVLTKEEIARLEECGIKLNEGDSWKDLEDKSTVYLIYTPDGDCEEIVTPEAPKTTTPPKNTTVTKATTPVAKAIQTTVSLLPNTGDGNVDWVKTAIGAGLLSVVGYMVYRHRKTSQTFLVAILAVGSVSYSLINTNGDTVNAQEILNCLDESYVLMAKDHTKESECEYVGYIVIPNETPEEPQPEPEPEPEAPKTGDVVVRYHVVDAEGNVVIPNAVPEVVDTPQSEGDTEYDTTDSTNPTSVNTKPDTITVDGKEYRRVDLNVDEDGKQINPHAYTDGVLADDETEDTHVSGTENGKVTVEKTTVINYYYEAIPEPEPEIEYGDVIVEHHIQYIDWTGEIAQDWTHMSEFDEVVVKDGEVGSAYDTTGYVLTKDAIDEYVASNAKPTVANKTLNGLTLGQHTWATDSVTVTVNVTDGSNVIDNIKDGEPKGNLYDYYRSTAAAEKGYTVEEWDTNNGTTTDGFNLKKNGVYETAYYKNATIIDEKTKTGDTYTFYQIDYTSNRDDANIATSELYWDESSDDEKGDVEAKRVKKIIYRYRVREDKTSEEDFTLNKADAEKQPIKYPSTLVHEVEIEDEE